jgi:Transposase DDE domain group 1
MTECKEQRWLFQDLGKRKVELDFGGGYLSSDGGGLILRELERHSGLLRDFAGCFVDYRDQRYVEHSVQELVSQRIYGLVLGYERSQ